MLVRDGFRRRKPCKLGMQFSPTGITYFAGTTQAAIVALERERDDGAITTRRISTSTGLLSALMGSDGSYLIIERPDPSSPGTVRYTVQPFGGGEERPIGTTQRQLDDDRSRTVDGQGLVVLTRQGDQVGIVEYDLASGRAARRGRMP